jgi:hypothetical protein
LPQKYLVKFSAAVLVAFALAFSSGAWGADGAEKFDGTWDTTISCSNTEGARGYSFTFPSVVKDGRLLGGKGTPRQPGWLELKGDILPNGSARLYARGLVGASQVAVGHLPPGSAYGYHVAAKFSGDEGDGKRVEGRPCEVAFVRRPAS